jgi:hypothetical protein
MAVKLSALRAGRPLPTGRFLVIISVRGWVDPRAIVWLEGLGQLQNVLCEPPKPTNLFSPLNWQEVAQVPKYLVGSVRYILSSDRQITEYVIGPARYILSSDRQITEYLNTNIAHYAEWGLERLKMARSVQRPAYRLDDWRVRVRFPLCISDFFLFHTVQTASVAYPVSFLSAKRAGCEANHSPTCSDEIKNPWSFTFFHMQLHGLVLKHVDIVNFYIQEDGKFIFVDGTYKPIIK